MPIRIQGTDGQEFEFPDGTSPDVMRRALQGHYSKQALDKVWNAPAPRSQAQADARQAQDDAIRAQEIRARDQALNQDRAISAQRNILTAALPGAGVPGALLGIGVEALRERARTGATARDASVDTGFLDRSGSLLESGAQSAIGGLDRIEAATTKSPASQQRARFMEDASAADIAGTTSWEDVKAADGFLDTAGSGLKYGMETMIQSLPEMALTALPYAGLASQAAVQTGRIGQERARNDGRENADLGDLVKAAPAAAASALLERVGIEAVTGKVAQKIGGRVANTALGRIGSGAVGEGATEFLQSGIEYAGGTVGTEAGFDPATALDQSIAGAVGGGVAGGVLSTGFEAGRQTVDTVAAIRQRRGAPGTIEQAQAEAAALTQSDIDSPLDTADIISGRVGTEGAIASNAADGALANMAMPGVGKRVVIDHGDGTTQTGTMADVFKAEDGEGVVVTLDDGKQFRHYSEDLRDAGVTIREFDPVAEAAATDARMAEMAAQAAEAPAPVQPEAPSPVVRTEPEEKVDTAGAIQRFMAKTRRVESGGKDNAKNPLSSATGRYQFIDSTWLGTYRAEFGNTGESDAEILAKRKDGALQDRLMKRLTTDNANMLARAGVNATEGNLYLAHFAGPKGATALHKADPNASAASVLGQAAINANPFLKGMSASDVIAWAARKMGGKAPETAQTDPAPEPEFVIPDREDAPALAGPTEPEITALPPAPDGAAEALLQPAVVTRPDEPEEAPTENADGVETVTSDVDGAQYVPDREGTAPRVFRSPGDAALYQSSNRLTGFEVVDNGPVDAGGTGGWSLRRIEAPEAAASRTPPSVVESTTGSAPSSAVIERTSTGKSVAVIGASKAEIDAITAAVPNAKAITRRDGALVYAKKYRREIEAALDAITTPAAAISPNVAPAPGAPVVGAGASVPSAKIKAARPPKAAAPVDMLKFIARNGGLSYDGMSERGREEGSRGHDLRNTGNLKAFVPGAGPLLRPGGRGLDDMGEMLHDAGYFGPPETTPRPDENEIIQMIDGLLRRKEKRYSFFDQAPEQRPENDTGQPQDDYEATVAQATQQNTIWNAWDQAAEQIGAQIMFPEEIDAARSSFEAGSDLLPPLDPNETDPEKIIPYLLEVINRELDQARLDAFYEVEDDFYAATEEQFRRAAAAEGRDRGDGGEGRAPDAGNPRAQPRGGDQGPGPAGSSGETGPLDRGEAVDPAIAERQRQEARLRAEAPLRGENRTGQAQDGTMGLGLFDSADQPQMNLAPPANQTSAPQNAATSAPGTPTQSNAAMVPADNWREKFNSNPERFLGALSDEVLTKVGKELGVSRGQRSRIRFIEAISSNAIADVRQAVERARPNLSPADNQELQRLKDANANGEPMDDADVERMLDLDRAAKAGSGTPGTPGTPVGSIGTNEDGDPIFEDARGVRSYVKNGVRLTESVGMIPKRGGGMELSVDKSARDGRYLTEAERAAQSAPQAPAADSRFAKNTLFTDDKVAAARARMAERMKRLNSGVDPEMLLDGMIIAGAHIEAGMRNFAEFAKTMRADFGDKITPYLLSFWEGARNYPGLETTGMTSPDVTKAMHEMMLADMGATTAPEGAMGGADAQLPNNVPASDAGPVTGNVQRTAQDRGDGRASGQEGSRGQGDVPRPDERTAGAAERGAGRPAGGTRGDRTGNGNTDRVPAADQGAGSRSSTARDAASVKGADWSIEPGSLAEDRSFAQKARDNVEAIALVKQIEAEGRPATRAEQEVIARYVGWGGIKNIFPGSDGQYGKGFEELGPRLRDLLTDEEYQTANRSIQYAHYTGETVVRAMWTAAERLGFRGGAVFEPGMGTGNFRGMMPAGISAASTYNGLEFDHLTASIARLLYPQSGVRQADYTATPAIKDAFDLVIGNPPFSETVVSGDPEYGKLRFLLHDFFFAKSLNAVKPGGLLMFVTSAGTMNKRDTKARAYLAERADLVGAIRLPGNAFEKNAGTSVTTDIVILRKRLPGEAPGNQDWIETDLRSLPDRDGSPHTGSVNRYFTQNPDMILGEEGFFDKLVAGPRYAVRAPQGFNLPQALAKAVSALPTGITSTAPVADVSKTAPALDLASNEKKDGSYYLSASGELMQFRGGMGQPVQSRGKGVKGGMSAADQERVRGLIPVKDALREVYSADLATDDARGAAARRKLNDAYDAFVKKFGPINKTDISYRRPSRVEIEGVRAAQREEARLAGTEWDDGSFDVGPMTQAGESLARIAEAREIAREAAKAAGRTWNEGSFDPDDVPDKVIEKRPNLDPFMEDEEGYRLAAIEHYNKETGEAAKGRVFFENAIKLDAAPAINSADDALLYSLNRLGRPDIGLIAEMAGMSQGEVLEALGDRLFEVPGRPGVYETSEMYLSGNVREKLAIARDAAARDPAFARNVAALSAAQPAPLTESEIAANLGMPWIPPRVIEQFATQHMGLASAKVRYLPKLAAWSAAGDSTSSAARSVWGTERMSAMDLLEAALNRQTPTIRDRLDDGKTIINPVATQAAQDKMAEIKAAFREWVWTDDARTAELVDLYNTNFNALVAPKFDGSYLTTPGISAGWQWRPHQRSVVSRIIQAGNTYMAHEVGAGKTSAMIGAGMEMKRLGLVNKPMYVVPNHMLGQFTKEFYEQYPLARIRVADEQRFHTSRRKEFIARLAADDLDAVIITHSAFGFIPMSDDFQAKMIDDQIAELNDLLSEIGKDQDSRVTRRKVQQQKEALEQRLRGLGNRKRDQVFTFEETGVDFLFVDEAHLFRKLDFSTKMGNVKGIDPSGSQMSFDLYSKTRYLEQQKPGRNLVLASGTPITNTMAELYSVSRYLQQGELDKRRLGHFDAWAGAFGDTKTELEQDPAGGYKSVTRFAQFVNVPELSVMVRQVMDVVGAAELRQYVTLPTLKGGERQMVIADMTPSQEAYKAELQARMEIIRRRSGPPKPGDDIILSVIGDGRKAAIDYRLIDASAPKEDGSKLEMMIDNVARLHKESARTPFHTPGPPAEGYSKKPAFHGPATQMIFSDFGINGDFPVHKYIKQSLVARGIPAGQIAIISDFKSSVARQRLFNDLNEGKVRVLIGSVAKMGTGVNAQKRLIAIHNMDAQWYPANDTQRNGRGIRQGNMNPEINIFDYSTQGTYDSTMWAMMARKGKFIEAFMRGDPSMRDMEDLGEASQYEQAAAMTTSDPRIMSLTEWKQDLEKLGRKKIAHERDQQNIRGRVTSARIDKERAEKVIPLIEQDIADRELPDGDEFTAKVDGKTYTDRSEFGAALMEAANAVLEKADGADLRQKVADLGGFSIVAEAHTGFDGRAVRFAIKRAGNRETTVDMGTDSRGLVTRLTNKLRQFESELANAKSEVQRNADLIADYSQRLGATYDDGGKSDELRAKIRDLEATLDAETKASEEAKNAATQAQTQQSIPEGAGIPTISVRASDWGNLPRAGRGRLEVLRGRVGRWYDTLAGTTITSSDGKEVRFSARGRGKTLRAGEDILTLARAIPGIISRGTLIETQAVRGKGVKAVHKYAANVRTEDGGTRPLVAIVRETSDGRYHYSLHNLVDASPDAPGKAGGVGPKASTPALDGYAGDEINLFAMDGESKPEGAASQSDLRDALQARLESYGLARKVALRVVDTLDGAAGDYHDMLVRIATDTKQDGTFTLDHEAIHALRDMGVFNTSEWAILSAKARRDPALMRSIRQRYPRLDAEAQIEEAVADLFARYQRGDYKAEGTVARVLKTLRQMLEVVSNWIAGRGAQTAEGVLGGVARGDVGARGGEVSNGQNRQSLPEDVEYRVSSPAGGARVTSMRAVRREAARQLGQLEQLDDRALEDVSTLGQDAEPTWPYTIGDVTIDRGTWEELDARGMRRFSIPEREDMVALGGVDPTWRGKMSDRFDTWRTRLQDRYNPLLKVQREIEKQTGKPLPPSLNPYVGEELMSGRVGARLERLAEDHVQPLFDAMHDEGVTTDELETYLYARHAPERNARMQEINPELADGEGSGMTDIEARAVMSRIRKAGKMEAMERLAARIDRIRDLSLDYRVESGLMSEKQAEEWRATYEFYVPLRGFKETEGSPDPARVNRSGGGINVRGRESRAAYGRRSKADSPLAYLIMQAEEAIVRGETNRVAQRFVKLAQDNPDPDFWEVNKVTSSRRLNEETGLVENYLVTNLTARDADWTVTAKFDGKERRVTMNRANPAAARLADSMRNLSQHEMDWITLHLGKLNRFLSAVNTSYNPEFVITNAFRDVQTAAFNLAGEEVKGLVSGTLKDYRKALVSSTKGAFGKHSGEWGRWYDEFVANGGRVYFNKTEDVSGIKKRIANIERMTAAKNGEGGPALQAKRYLLATRDTIENLNLGVENAVRLAAYKNARERGMSPEQAASLAKNLTVNFNRRGTAGPALNAAYLFFNASMQGSVRLIQAAGSPRVRKLLAATMVGAAMVELLNAMVSGDDEDGEIFYDKIPAHEKARNLIVMLPDGHSYIKLPLPYGYNAFWAAGRSVAEIARRGGDRWKETAGEFVGTVVDAFNPIGGAQSLLTFLSPTALDPIVDLTLNKDFTGRPIMPEQEPYGSEVPDSQRYWGSVAPHWRAITDALSGMTGGDGVVPGAIEVSPETLEYMAGFVMGAAGAFVDRVIGLGGKILDPDVEVTTNDVVFARKVVGDKSSWYDKAAYYDRLREVDQRVDEARAYLDADNIEAAQSYADKERSVLSLEPAAKQARKDMREIRKARRENESALEKGAIDKAAYRERKSVVDEAEKVVILRFNTAWNEAMAGGGE